MLFCFLLALMRNHQKTPGATRPQHLRPEDQALRMKDIDIHLHRPYLGIICMVPAVRARNDSAISDICRRGTETRPELLRQDSSGPYSHHQHCNKSFSEA